eukprot:5986555-Lingulodinium_polyedra.AAC.1
MVKTTLGSQQGHGGVTAGSRRDRGGVAVVAVGPNPWGHNGVTVGSPWGHRGVTVGSPWDRHG